MMLLWMLCVLLLRCRLRHLLMMLLLLLLVERVMRANVVRVQAGATYTHHTCHVWWW